MRSAMDNQAPASGTASRFIGTIKSLENIKASAAKVARLRFRCPEDIAFSPPILFEGFTHVFPLSPGILLGIVQQDIHFTISVGVVHAALYMNILNDPLLQHTSAARAIIGLKGQQRLLK